MSNTTEDLQVVVVTGGARGIGLAIVKWFLAHNYRVAVLDIDRQTLGASLDDGERVLAIPCDIASPEQVEAAAHIVSSRWGRVDALINNAGVAVFKPALDTSYADSTAPSCAPRLSRRP